MIPSKNPSIRIVKVDIDADYTPPEDWKLNAINDVVVGDKVTFYAVLIKPAKPQPTPVNLDKTEDPKAPTPQA